MTDPHEDRRPSIGALIRAGAPSFSALGQRAGWGRLKTALGRGETARGRRPFMILAAGTLVVALAIAGGVIFRAGGPGRPASALTYAIDRGEIRGGGTIRNADPIGARLRFSDGTRVTLKAAARAQMVSVESRGARIALSDGELAVDVAHRPSARWRFDAGPFSVFVEGTSFSLAWTAADERLQLRMYSGVVTVTGPLGTDAIKVRADETLTVRLPEQEIALVAGAGVGVRGTDGAPSGEAPLTPNPPPRLAPNPAPSLAPMPGAILERAPAGATSPAAARRLPGATGRSSWRELVAAGRSSDVVADAETRGLGVTLARGGREDLAALSDAARYGRRNDIARRTLHALRDRFATSESARDAAFFLGRLEEADNLQSPRSLEWYRRYRAEAPNGLYVSDSLGREMLVMQRLYGDDEARATAREYIARFPSGHLAGQAAKIESKIESKIQSKIESRTAGGP